MRIIIDKNKRITSYALIGELQGAIEVDDFEFMHPIYDYVYENGKIKYSPDLDKLKKLKRDELKNIRIEKLYENITVNGDTFQVRKDDLENFWEVDYMLKRREVAETDTRNWILADNSIKTFTYAQLMNVLTEFIKRKDRIFEKFGELSIKLVSCKSVEEIETIKWQ
ncbi:DUF4376 domain-containing protein [Fusobacterium polymorphum]|uniref:DUF4376 domain-containing protein n=1 Tax=Fusobacterium nucleatum CTI-6 TaxID=1316587 RepID=U7TUR8_FUSNU|nr:DUF4376 domain-containing protein [Fusobacterium nucleatum]ERT47647.1 hypothetical protein HMPREF1767_01207 [Fusobacterium nucleatum CTI-6]